MCIWAQENTVAIPQNPIDANNLLKQAYRLELGQRYDEAISRYQATLSFFSDNPYYSKEILAIHAKIIELYLQQERFLLALDFSQKAAVLAKRFEHTAYQAKFYEKLSIIYQCLAKESTKKLENSKIEPLDFGTRKVILEIISKENKEILPAKVIAYDQQSHEKFELDSSSEIFPGKYQFNIIASGFEEYKFSDEVIASTEPYKISKILSCTGRELELNITGDFPADEKIDPDIITLNGVDAREIKTIPPGKYELEISSMGYFPIKEIIEVNAQAGVYILNKVLSTSPRIIKEKITYDVPPTPQLKPYRITLAPFDNPDEESLIKEGDSVKPGVYKIRIYKEGYVTIDEKKAIWASSQPIILAYELESKERTIHVTIEHDVAPPANLEWSIALIAEEKASRYDKKKIKPGTYTVEIQQPGYFPLPKQKIYIEPSEEDYKMAVNFTAKPRSISYDITEENSWKIVTAEEVWVNNQRIQQTDTFKPGIEVTIQFKFKEYADVIKNIRIVPGEGAITEKAALQPLKRYEIKTRKNSEKMPDGTFCSIVFAVDSKPVEDFHIEKEQIKNDTIYRIWLDPQVTTLRIYTGYLYSQNTIAYLEKYGIPNANSIDLTKLLGYLSEHRVKDENGFSESLRMLEKVVRSPSMKRLFKQCSSSDIDKFIHQIQLWDFYDDSDYMRVREIVEILDMLKS